MSKTAYAAKDTTSTLGTQYAWEACHTGQVDVMTIGKAVIWSGKWDDMNDDLSWDLRIRLSDRFRWGGEVGSPLLTADEGAKALLLPEVTGIKYPPTLSVDWRDFGSPALDRQWWEGLVRSFQAWEGDQERAVALYCEGGHGRTGTALSILASLSGQVPEGDDPVAWVRKNYCQEAVESWAQVDYIEHMTGAKVSVHPTSVKKQNYMPAYSKNADGQWEVEFSDPSVVKKITPANSQFNSQMNNAKAVVQKLNASTGKKGK